jgi:hypothetical protein
MPALAPGARAIDCDEGKAALTSAADLQVKG